MALDTEPRWSLSPPVFEKLLERLASDREAGAREYEVIRRKLVEFFDRRHARAPDALADETIDRAARRLHEGEAVQHVRAYFYGIARRVLLESHKQQARERAAEPELQTRALAAGSVDDSEIRVGCLKHCLEELPAESRELIVAYYHGRGVSHLTERKELARRLGLTYVTLKTRAHRVRNRLRDCLQTCLEARARETNGPRGTQLDRGPGTR
jgi:RNA polymerase sigma factor (sigma-70 family)